MDENLHNLEKSVLEAPVVWKGKYPYFVHPLTDGVPRLEAHLLNGVADLIHNLVNWNAIDVILGIEAMGLPLTSLLSSKTGKPMVVARKRSYGLENEVRVDQSTGYSKGEIYLNDLHKGENVLIVDDVLSTGGTMESIISGIKRTGAVIQQIIVVFEKGDGLKKVSKKCDIKIESLVKIKMIDDKVTILRGDN